MLFNSLFIVSNERVLLYYFIDSQISTLRFGGRSGKIKDHCRHHTREGAHIDRTNHLDNGSGSTLVNHLLQQGLGHGTHKHQDSAGCCDESQR